MNTLLLDNEYHYQVFSVYLVTTVFPIGVPRVIEAREHFYVVIATVLLILHFES